MVSPTPVNPPGQTADSARGLAVSPAAGNNTTSRLLDTFGFHLLFVLLGIALAFM
jgi:hypothetical protein